MNWGSVEKVLGFRGVLSSVLKGFKFLWYRWIELSNEFKIYE